MDAKTQERTDKVVTTLVSMRRELVTGVATDIETNGASRALCMVMIDLIDLIDHFIEEAVEEDADKYRGGG